MVIPTIDRLQELKKLLASFATQTVKPYEIVIVDQSKEPFTGWLKEFKDLPLKIYPVNFQSLTKARNYGVSRCGGDVIGFLDDDIILDKDYVKNILQFFVVYPQALGVQGLITNFEVNHTAKVGGNRFIYRLYNWFAKIFFLNNSSRTNRLLWSGRNQYASRVDKVARCEWLSGIGNYRREVFDEFSFDENLDGYALGEDKLFSYPIFEKHSDSLFLDPAMKCEHHHNVSGQPQSRAWVKMKVCYTYYLWNKFFRKHGFLAYFSYIWANIGDLITVLFSIILYQNRPKFFWWHLVEYSKIVFLSQRDQDDAKFYKV